MRMNRGTIVLIAALLVVIVAVLVINNNQASAPGVTPTVAADAGGVLLPAGTTADNIVHYEVRDNVSGNFTSLSKDTGGAWHIDGTNTLPDRSADQSLIGSTASQIVSINYNNTFQDDQLATFGLDKPAYTIEIQTSDSKLYTLYVGAKAPTSSRYYTVLLAAAANTAPEATTESGAAPQAIATENVAAQQQNGSNLQPTAAPTNEATAEATSAVAKKLFRALQEATAEATAESTLDNVTSAQATVEPTAELLASTAEANPEITEVPTADVIQNPEITLTGKQTIYVIPQTVIDTLTRWINTPPYAALPTAVPTDLAAPQELPTPLLEEGANPQLIPAGTPFATQETTPEATAAATAAS